jgi:hypothetical protein
MPEHMLAETTAVVPEALDGPDRMPEIEKSRAGSSFPAVPASRS